MMQTLPPELKYASPTLRARRRRKLGQEGDTISSASLANRDTWSDSEERLRTPRTYGFLEGLLIPRSPEIKFLDPYNVLPYSAAQNLDEVSRWFFYSHVVSGPGSWAELATLNWGRKFWDFARASSLVFHLLMLMVVHKQSRLVGRTPDRIKAYHLHKHHVISSVRQELLTQESTSNTSSVVAICGLAMFALRESDYDGIAMHMKVMKTLHVKAQIEPSEWLYIAWIDLLVASILLQGPTLPYRDLSALRGRGAVSRYGSEQSRRPATRNVRELPQCPLVEVHKIFEVFVALHEIQTFTLQRHKVFQNPLPDLYDIYYRICVLHDSIKSSGCYPLLEAIMIVLHLNFWSASRFWAPLHEDVPRRLLSRLAELQDSFDTARGGLVRSLGKSAQAWVQFTAYTWSIVYHPAESSAFQSRLRAVLADGNMKREKDLHTALMQWPLAYSSHMSSVSRVWRSLEMEAPKRWVKIGTESAKTAGFEIPVKHDNKFVAIFEFHVNGDS